MHNLTRDLNRLHLMGLEPALESLSLTTRVQDFFRYYFSRFVGNLTHALKPFSASEIKDWNRRHRISSDLIHHRLELQQHRLVPIPKGMIHPYAKTLAELTNILSEVSVSTIRSDVDLFLRSLKSGKVVNIPPASFEQGFFLVNQNHVASLYAEPGLSHRPVQDVMGSASDVLSTNAELSRLVDKVYPDIIEINKKLTLLESAYSHHQWSVEQTAVIKAYCMSLGYRLTLFAIVGDHLQKLEHQFVESMNILVVA